MLSKYVFWSSFGPDDEFEIRKARKIVVFYIFILFKSGCHLLKYLKHWFHSSCDFLFYIIKYSENANVECDTVISFIGGRILKNLDIEKLFWNEKLMRNISLISIICGIVSLIILCISNKLGLLLAFEKVVKIVITLLVLRSFSQFRWDVMKGMMGGLLFALLYQESFLVLGRLWGETSDFDFYLIMGVQGSLYLAAQSMSFLMTVIIILNHFIIDYSRIGNYRNVLFNQISIIFKVLLYILLMIVNVFLNQPLLIQINSGIEYISDLCIVILIICIETQLDGFKTIRQDLLKDKKMRNED